MTIPLGFPSPSRLSCVSFLDILLPTEWEVQNHIPSGTVLKALIEGGESVPWVRFMRGEVTTEAFLQEFGRLCSELVSDKDTCISSLFPFALNMVVKFTQKLVKLKIKRKPNNPLYVFKLLIPSLGAQLIH
jgi:hypothetical protein